MIYSVNFVDMTLKLNPLAVTKYLSETNWELYPIKRNDIKIFQYKKEDLFEQVTIPLDKMLMYGKEASNRKQEINRQHHTIPNQRPKDKHYGNVHSQLYTFPRMPTMALL